MNLPEKFTERMKEELKDEYSEFIECYNKEPEIALRVNTLKIPPEEFKKAVDFCEEGVPWCSEAFYYKGKMGNHPSSLAGLFYSQEPSAMLTAELADIKEGEVVLDLCAAPGGKSTQLAAKLNGTGLLVSNEIVTSRAKILSENIERFGVRNAVVTNMSPEGMEEHFPEFFDKIIVDAPCSGEGMFRKDPDAVREWSIEHTVSCAQRQFSIIKSAEKMLKKGGELIYSTCTFSKEENENLCEKVNSETDLKLCEMHKLLPHKVRGEGHFAAKFKKEGTGERKERKPIKTAKEDIVKIYRDFEKENLNAQLSGNFAAFGDFLYLVPREMGTLDKIKCTRAGLLLGEIRKGRFIPSHHLCMALKKEEFKRTYSLTDEEIDSYRKGESIRCEAEKGYGAVLYKDKYSVGWYKYSDGVLKNHYPKYLR